MTSYRYIIMIIVDSFIIWFHLDRVMQLQKSCYIATNVSSTKSATTFGDLPQRKPSSCVGVCVCVWRVWVWG